MMLDQARLIRSHAIGMFLVIAFSACTTDENAENAPAPEVVVAESTDGMPAVAGESRGETEARDPLEVHMQMMETATAEEVRQMVPQHRQLTANMIAEYNRQMSSMNMANNAEWNSTVDSLRQDLVRLPQMTSEELGTFIPEHKDRIGRLREMHRMMMGEAPR